MDDLSAMTARLMPGGGPKKESFEDMMNMDIKPKAPPVKKSGGKKDDKDKKKSPGADAVKISSDRSKIIVRKNASKK
jgi:hypothetical protein